MKTRAAGILALSFVAALAAGQDSAGFRKDYFGATAVGAWARYRMTSPGAQEGFTTYTRLADEDGQQRIRVRVEFTQEGRRNIANNEYTLEKGFSLEKDALGFGRAVDSAVTWQGNDPPEELPDEALEDIQSMAPDFGDRARFVASETVSGRKCDHYRYSQKHPGDPVTFEAGEIWLDPTVPFGVVRQTGELTDSRGHFVSSYAMLLMDSGKGPAPPPRTRRAEASTPVKLADAYGDGQVEILADVADGGAVKALFKNISQDTIRLTIPSGPTALEVGAPVGTLHLESTSTWLFDLAPGETSEAVELRQGGGSPRVTSGKFSAHLSGGKPVFTGNASLDAAR